MADMPFPLHDAILRALMFLSWEELPDDERPPRRIWLYGDDLRDWFREVRARRDEKYGTGNSNSQIEDPVDNPAAKDLMSG